MKFISVLQLNRYICITNFYLHVKNIQESVKLQVSLLSFMVLPITITRADPSAKKVKSVIISDNKLSYFLPPIWQINGSQNRFEDSYNPNWHSLIATE